MFETGVRDLLICIYLRLQKANLDEYAHRFQKIKNSSVKETELADFVKKMIEKAEKTQGEDTVIIDTLNSEPSARNISMKMK